MVFLYNFLVEFKLDENNKKKHSVHLRNDEKCEISSFSWGRTPQEVLIGFKNGSSKIYNLITEESINIKRLGYNKIIGVVPYQKYAIQYSRFRLIGAHWA